MERVRPKVRVVDNDCVGSRRPRSRRAPSGLAQCGSSVAAQRSLLKVGSTSGAAALMKRWYSSYGNLRSQALLDSDACPQVDIEFVQTTGALPRLYVRAVDDDLTF